MNTALQTLTEHQRAVTARALAQEAARRTHVVVSLSGAHAYGFPSPDSDLDLKCVHLAPTRVLLGFPRTPPPAERLEVIDGVEFDYSSNELGGVLYGLLKGNGNYFERFLSRFAVSTGPGFEALVPVISRALSTRVARHYAGFATQQREAWRATGQTSTKKLLYVVRTTLTGVHVLLTGALETDVTLLAPRYGLDDVLELVEQKRRGEQSALPPALAEKWGARVEGLFTRLTEAERNSVLPPEAPNADELEAALIELRQTSGT
jgi:predicted nucleotidyltransferase